MRLLDTRPTGSTIDSAHVGGGRIAAGGTYVLDVGGRNGLPRTFPAAALNVTAVEPSAPGFVTLYPCDTGRPNASLLNFAALQTVANMSVVRLGNDGRVCLFSSTDTDLVVDLQLAIQIPTFTGTPAPSRLLDTRSPAAGGATVDGIHVGAGRLAAGSTYTLPVTGRGGLATNARNAVLNVAVVSATGGGFLTVYQCDASRPTASNLNFRTGQTVANMVLTRLAASGSVCVFTSVATDLIVDVTGSFVSGSGQLLDAPARYLDTRPNAYTIDGQFGGLGALQAGHTGTLPIGGRAGVPADAYLAVLTVTAVDTRNPGFLTVYPCGAPRPNASNINFGRGETVAGSVMVLLGESGGVCVFSSAPTDVIVDVTGFAPNPTRPNQPPAFPNRRTVAFETRVSYSNGVPANATTTLRLDTPCSDPDGGVLVYSWAVSNGSIQANGLAATWQRALAGGVVPGDVTISCIDPYGARDETKLTDLQ